MKLKYMIKNAVIVVLFIVVAYFICEATPYYIDNIDYGEKVRVIIDDVEKTNELPDEAILKDGEVLFSLETAKKYIDPDMFFSENTLKINYDKYIVKMPIDDQVITINTQEKVINVPVQVISGELYIPIKHLEEIYDISVEYNEKVIISTNGSDNFSKAELAKNTKLKKYKRENGLTIKVLKKGDTIEIATPDFETILPDEYVYVRSSEGDLGYIKKSKLKLVEIENEVIINGVNESRRLPDEVKIQDGKALFSLDTIEKYIDEYIYYDKKYDTVIASRDSNIAKMKLNDNKILINDDEKIIDVPAQLIDERIYIPIEEFNDIYGIEVTCNDNIVITTKDAKYYTFILNSNVKIKEYPDDSSNTIHKTNKEEKLEVFDKNFDMANGDDFISVRTSNGKIGYLRKSNLAKAELINSPINMIDESDYKKTISLVWEYAANYTPDRSNEGKIKGINIVSPTWVYVKNDSGDIRENVSTTYISWAEKNGYEVWPTIKNDDIGIEKTSVLVTDMNKRKNFVDNIVKLCEKYNFKGINLDFEHMYQKDRDEFVILVRELAAMLEQNGVVTSVDVNVPDGSSEWSLCYDSKAISDACDYIMVMAYDQYGQSSKISGPVASLKWVDLNLSKMIERDGIESQKIILGVPFYSRYWKEKDGTVLSTSALSMSKAKEYINSNQSSTTWNDELGQHVVSYTTQGNQINIYVEDEKSLEKKIELVEKYNLAGIAAWRRGFETNDVWQVIADITN